MMISNRKKHFGLNFFVQSVWKFKLGNIVNKMYIMHVFPQLLSVCYISECTCGLREKGSLVHVIMVWLYFSLVTSL